MFKKKFFFKRQDMLGQKSSKFIKMLSLKTVMGKILFRKSSQKRLLVVF